MFYDNCVADMRIKKGGHMDYDLLKEELEKKNISYEEMARCLNMSVSTFYRKIGNQTSPFSIRDADIIKKKLNISRNKAAIIFFDK